MKATSGAGGSQNLNQHQPTGAPLTAPTSANSSGASTQQLSQQNKHPPQQQQQTRTGAQREMSDADLQDKWPHDKFDQIVSSNVNVSGESS